MKIKSVIITLFISALATLSYAQGFIMTYPQEPKAILNANYTVFANEIPVSVYSVVTNSDIPNVHFSFARKVTVRIHVKTTVNRFDLSPHSYGILSTKLGQDIMEMKQETQFYTSKPFLVTAL